MIERRRRTRRLEDVDRSGLVTFLVGCVYGVVVALFLWAWVFPILGRYL